jgi:segregation and condensation protein A
VYTARDIPTFKLEGVIKSKDDFEDFEGPLALILQLLSKNKIEIKDISISLILDQYTAYLKEMTAMNLDVASEFVAMASHLVYIKTKMLLSGDEEISELEQLITSLEELQRKDSYIQIKAATSVFESMYRRGAGYLVKQPEPLPEQKTYRYVHNKQDLYDAFLRAVDKGDGTTVNISPRPFTIPKRIIYSVTDKASEIIERLRTFRTIRIRTLFEESRSRSELVASFIAILELCKAGNVILTECGGDAVITRTAHLGSQVMITADLEGEKDGNT